MSPETTLSVRLADSSADHEAARRLRYDVFVRELGADGPLVDHEAGTERDAFDDHAESLILIDEARPPQEQVVGVYRLMDGAAAQRAGGFYTAQEYDLGPLVSTGRPMLELGRSCLHADYRGGAGLLYLWQALASVIEARGIELLFGVASFPGTDVQVLAQPLSLLARDHLAPPELRARARLYQDMALTDDIDRRRALQQMPALMKAYLRLGGFVGDGAFVDHGFNTTDIFLVVDTARMNARQRAIYGAKA